MIALHLVMLPRRLMVLLMMTIHSMILAVAIIHLPIGRMLMITYLIHVIEEVLAWLIVAMKETIVILMKLVPLSFLFHILYCEV